MKVQPTPEPSSTGFTEEYGLWTRLGESGSPHSTSQFIFMSTVGLDPSDPRINSTPGRTICSKGFPDERDDFGLCQGCFQVIHGTGPLLKDGSLAAGEKFPGQYLDVGVVVRPNDAKNSSELRLLESLQTFDIPTIQNPGLASVQNGGEDHGREDHDFVFYGGAVNTEDPV